MASVGAVNKKGTVVKISVLTKILELNTWAGVTTVVGKCVCISDKIDKESIGYREVSSIDKIDKEGTWHR